MQAQQSSFPKTLSANAAFSGANSGLTATFTIHVESLMPDVTFKIVSDALRHGGYPNFLPALRRMPVIGYIELGGNRTEIKYARVRASDSHLILGTDRPIFFVGGGFPDPKPKAGFEIGLLDLDVDAQGNGTGVMAAAARVKPAPDGSVIVDDYADAPIKLSVKPRDTS